MCCRVRTESRSQSQNWKKTSPQTIGFEQRAAQSAAHENLQRPCKQQVAAAEDENELAGVLGTTTASTSIGRVAQLAE